MTDRGVPVVARPAPAQQSGTAQQPNSVRPDSVRSDGSGRPSGTARPPDSSDGSGRPEGSGQRFVHYCPLRWSDMDAYGHVNNARFLTLYEEARVAMMFVGARSQGLTSFEEGVVIARHEIDYLRPVSYDTRSPGADVPPPSVRIEMWVEDVGTARFTIGYELFDGPVVAGRARSVLAPFDLAAGRPRRLTDRERAFLRAYSPGDDRP